MTSFTRKLHTTNPSAARVIHLQYGKRTQLLMFTLADRQDAEIHAEFRAANPQRAARLDSDYNDDPAQDLGLNRWADRSFK